jgi:hypothetical protein
MLLGRPKSRPRLRLRQRLVLFSTPVVIVALLVAFKMISVVIAGNAAVSDVKRQDVGALRGDVSTLSLLNVIGPENVAFAKGDLAALEGKLGEADSQFSDLLSRTAASRSCPLRINSELVRETQGDLAARDQKLDQAEQRYTAALAMIKEAPRGCFDANSDPDRDRRAIKNDAAARLADKIRALHVPPPLPAPAPPPPPPPPPPSGGATGSGSPVHSDVNPDRLPGTGPAPELRLDPGSPNPVQRLQEALANSDAAGQDDE